MLNRLYKSISVLLLVLIAGCATPKETIDTSLALEGMPPIQREFRAAWIATVDNIDWPSEKGLPVLKQQEELRTMFDRAVQLNLNALILQIRPTADAFYASDLEPWSEYLTGQQGLAPEPFYDPLEFAVEEAHRRGLELHVWFNPFRAFHPSAEGPIAPNHVSRTMPLATKQYGEMMWLDPGDPDAQEHSLQVMLDVVRRYDIDGVHMDDYFYPYSITDEEGNTVDFPDDASFEAALNMNPTLTRSDWRRSNIDTFVQRLYNEVKDIKLWVKVGISPFGIWRPGNPPQVRGFDAFEGLYADSRKWLNRGWVDYYTPQLYWEIASEGQPYGALLDWWIGENLKNRHIWPGNFTSRTILEGTRYWDPMEVVNQVRETRGRSQAGGNVHFSMRALMPDAQEAGEALHTFVYQDPALVPASPWLDQAAPGPPELRADDFEGNLVLRITPTEGADVGRWVIRARYGGIWKTVMVPAGYPAVLLESHNGRAKPEIVVVTGVSRTGVDGPYSVETFNNTSP